MKSGAIRWDCSNDPLPGSRIQRAVPDKVRQVRSGVAVAADANIRGAIAKGSYRESRIRSATHAATYAAAARSTHARRRARALLHFPRDSTGRTICPSPAHSSESILAPSRGDTAQARELRAMRRCGKFEMAS
ncbi:hypothetical protein HPB50_015930 [Hyalomma asiaticum]|uniref:Uncharacterized protein n=1 Tax=Hyalomma asiaticum TaxID=266040 RepID=A0ACB7RVM7_HYAAI|nr:hypothetical protein HPB50_015930 [Hyalomma asiaticum]